MLINSHGLHWECAQPEQINLGVLISDIFFWNSWTIYLNVWPITHPKPIHPSLPLRTHPPTHGELLSNKCLNERLRILIDNILANKNTICSLSCPLLRKQHCGNSSAPTHGRTLMCMYVHLRPCAHINLTYMHLPLIYACTVYIHACICIYMYVLALYLKNITYFMYLVIRAL